MMESKAHSVLFAKTPKLCVLHTEVSTCYNFKFGTSFSIVSLKILKWGVLANRLSNPYETKGNEAQPWRM